jgi:uncharacterized membrane protein YkoI
MKINRFIALAAIALLIVGAMGFITVRGLAQVVASHNSQAQVTEAPDPDNVEEQVGDQNEADTAEQGSSTEVEDSADTPESKSQDAAGSDNETDQSALQSQTTITVEQAQQAALAENAGGTILKTDLDDENGALVYSVEFTGGFEVKVDAMTGTILRTESGED